jgi:hypothetical protein
MTLTSRPVMLFRKDIDTAGEMEIASKYFNVVEHRTDCRKFAPWNEQGNLRPIVCRYSCLPYYGDLEYDLAAFDHYLINSHKQHKWIADFQYYQDLAEFTPESWDDSSFYKSPEGQYVVKGKTNSRKWDWNKLMFAPTKKAAAIIGAELSTDGLIGPQGIIYRKYIPLKTFEIGLNGLPFSNEYRFFYLKTKRLSGAYYWACAENIPNGVPDAAIEFADRVAQIAAKYVNFFVLDIAEKQDGGWILIEINDGQMSGLSENDPDVLYKNLNEAMR